jgi:hypothetical protein
MGPRLAAEQFKQHYPEAVPYRVTLFGSLAAAFGIFCAKSGG